MTWTRAIFYLAIWAVLGAYYVAFERSPQMPSTPPERSAQANRFVPFRAESVTRLSLDAHGTRLRCDLRDGQWHIVEPVDARVPVDLIAAIIATLTELPVVDVIPTSAGTPANQFGLDADSIRLSMGTSTDEVRLQLGARNPSQTAVYARREGTEEIVLVGLNVQYYVDLLIEALRRHPA